MTDTFVRFLVGDVFDVLATLADDSVDLVLTSPPFLALRSYLPADHANKAKEIGSEPTPAAYIDRLLDVVEALDRVLAPHGSLCIELGDTYSGSGDAGGDYNPEGLRAGQPRFDGSARRQRSGWHRSGAEAPDRYRSFGAVDSGSPNGGPGWPLAKSRCLIPESFRWALAYGANPFNGRTTPPWRVRNVVRWCRPNPPVGALGDKFRPATTELVIACHAVDRYFDLDAVRQPHSELTMRVKGKKWAENSGTVNGVGHPSTKGMERSLDVYGAAPPLDWWQIPTEPYPGAHYATWPSELCIQPIKAMCPERVCRSCGQPARRVVRTVNAVGHAVQCTAHRLSPNGAGDGRRNVADINHDAPDRTETQTLGWTACGHDNWRSGVVLDPFAGSGTTLAVAHGHGRSAIGIDLDERNAWLARDRVGLWLDLEVGR